MKPYANFLPVFEESFSRRRTLAHRESTWTRVSCCCEVTTVPTHIVVGQRSGVLALWLFKNSHKHKLIISSCGSLSWCGHFYPATGSSSPLVRSGFGVLFSLGPREEKRQKLEMSPLLSPPPTPCPPIPPVLFHFSPPLGCVHDATEGNSCFTWRLIESSSD